VITTGCLVPGRPPGCHRRSHISLYFDAANVRDPDCAFIVRPQRFFGKAIADAKRWQTELARGRRWRLARCFFVGRRPPGLGFAVASWRRYEPGAGYRGRDRRRERTWFPKPVIFDRLKSACSARPLEEISLEQPNLIGRRCAARYCGEIAIEVIRRRRT